MGNENGGRRGTLEQLASVQKWWGKGIGIKII